MELASPRLGADIKIPLTQSPLSPILGMAGVPRHPRDAVPGLGKPLGTRVCDRIFHDCHRMHPFPLQVQ